MKVPDLLRTMDIFENLPAEDLDSIARLLRERHLAEGEVLFRQGDPGDAMFIVTGGTIRLWSADPAGGESTLARLSDGQFFGEMALLTGAPRASTASAETESRVLVLQRDDFDQVLASNAPIMREMLKVVSQRTVQTNQQLLAEHPGSGAAVGGGRVYVVYSPRGGAGKTTLAVNLAAALSRHLPDRVGLLDLDLTFGQAPAFLGLTPEASLASLPPDSLEQLDRRTLGEYLVRHESGMYALAGALRPEEGEAVTGEYVRAALAVMKRQFQATVVDCGPVLNDPALAAVDVADKLLLVCTPELSTLRDVRECQRVFSEVVHVDRANLAIVLNHYQPFQVLSREQFEAALEQSVALEIPHAGDAALKAAMRGEPLVLSAPGCGFARSIDRLAQTLLPSELKAVHGRAHHAAPAQPSGQNGHVRARRFGVLGRFIRAA